MPLAPGPFPPLPAEEFELEPDPPDQEAAELEAHGEHLLLEQEFLALLSLVQEQFAADPVAPIDEAVEPARSFLVDDIQEPIEDTHPDILGAAPEVDQAIIDAVAEAPGEAWQLLPLPFEYPVDDPGFDPSEQDRRVPDRTPFTPPREVLVGVFNLDRVDAPDFLVGERFRVNISGPPGGIVSVHAWWNGEDNGVWSWPDRPVNPAGRWFLEDVMPELYVGSWVEQWSVGEAAATPTITFEVRRA